MKKMLIVCAVIGSAFAAYANYPGHVEDSCTWKSECKGTCSYSLETEQNQNPIPIYHGNCVNSGGMGCYCA